MAHVLDERKRLSESLLWPLQEAFYKEVGIKAWTKAIVPNFVTSNAFICNNYAKLILAFIHDWYQRKERLQRAAAGCRRANSSDEDAEDDYDQSDYDDHYEFEQSGANEPYEPVYIIEIGAGHGKFGFSTLTKLLALRSFWPTTSDSRPPFVYVLTDFAASNINYWKRQDTFRRFIDAGIVDFAMFNAQKDSSLRLHLSGRTISRATCRAPIVAITNYIFDTLKQDAFRMMAGGRLQEALCTVMSDRDEPDITDPNVIRRIHCKWAYRDIKVKRLRPAQTSGSNNTQGANKSSSSSSIIGDRAAGHATNLAAAAAGTSAGGVGGGNGNTNINNHHHHNGHSATMRPQSPLLSASRINTGKSKNDENNNRHEQHNNNNGNGGGIDIDGNALPPDILELIKRGPRYQVEYYRGGNDPEFNAHLNALLECYLEKDENCSVLIPIGGLKALRNLVRIARADIDSPSFAAEVAAENQNRKAPPAIAGNGAGWLLLLAGDKAYTQEQEMCGLRDPHIALHGSFSFMVNFHAVGLYAALRGGFALQTPYLDGFKCASFALGAEAGDLPEMRLQWMECMETFGPDNFSTFQRAMKDETPSPSLKNVLAVLRLSQFDTDVFYKFKQILIDKAPFASEKQQNDIKRDVLEVYRGYYPLSKGKDIAFEMGRLMMGLKEYGRAISFFTDSQSFCGEHHVSWYNMGICFNYTGKLQDALQCFKNSLVLRPDYHDARGWRARIESRIGMM